MLAALSSYVDMSERACVSMSVFITLFKADISCQGLNPQVPGLWRSVAVDAQVPQGGTLPPLNVKAGDRIWASFRNAHLNVCLTFFLPVLTDDST
jgi:hypothetical protein